MDTINAFVPLPRSLDWWGSNFEDQVSSFWSFSQVIKTVYDLNEVHDIKLPQTHETFKWQKWCWSWSEVMKTELIRVLR